VNVNGRRSNVANLSRNGRGAADGTRSLTSPKTARAAGLEYVSDDTPGISRVRSGKGFAYRDARGRLIRNRRVLARIRALVIPPAWENVWISPKENSHLQVTGRDARGRKQYRYHPRWTEQRDSVKYDRMIAFGSALPAIRKRIAADLKQAPLSRPRVLATVVRLLERTLIRVGNEEYARANGSYGLTTLQDRHVEIRGPVVRFRFRAKSGVKQAVELEDRTLATSVRRCQELPGQILFQYLDVDGRQQSVGSRDVNEYLRDIAGQDFTAKDFRTWAGTVLAACALVEQPPAQSATGLNKQIVQAVDRVAARLGNTRAVCRRCYIHPEVLDAFQNGSPVPMKAKTEFDRLTPPVSGLSREERAVLAILKRGKTRTRRTAAAEDWRSQLARSAALTARPASARPSAAASR
jgi:DNA topoisomerase-1